MRRTNKTESNEKLAVITNKLRDNILIVEGKKDKRALYNLGLKNIIAINGKTLSNVVDDVNKELAGKEGSSVVILTDFDHEGRKLAAKLRILLQRLKIHPNTGLRKMLMSFGKNNVESLTPQLFGVAEHKIEDFNAGLVPADLNRGDYHVKVSTDVNKVHNQGSHKSEGGCRKT